MAMAKNFVKHGVWGITKYGFTSSSSSPLWTLLLSGTYLIFGVNEYSPLILNIIFSFFIIILISNILKKEKFKNSYIILTILAIFLLTPIFSILLLGEEHILQILIDLLFLYKSYEFFYNPERKTKIILILVAPFLTTVRLEGLFILFVISSIFFINKKRKLAILLIISGILPLLIYGIISIQNGWYFLPNPVLLKGNTPEIKTVWGFIAYSFTWIKNLFKYSHILLIFIGILLFLKPIYKKDKKYLYLGLTYIAILILHLQFARVGWLYRYEAYLMTIGLLIIVILIKETKNFYSRKIVITFLIITTSLLLFRGIHAITRTVKATKNIHDQQYQMGLFLKEFYRGHSVALNDIGVANYLADIKCVDLCGLANLDVFKIIKKGEYNTYKIGEITLKNKVEISVAFKNWFNGEFPENWIEVGTWKIKNNVICYDDTIHFFGINKKNALKLLENLRKFSSKLPEDITQRGLYLK